MWGHFTSFASWFRQYLMVLPKGLRNKMETHHLPLLWFGREPSTGKSTAEKVLQKKNRTEHWSGISFQTDVSLPPDAEVARKKQLPPEANPVGVEFPNSTSGQRGARTEISRLRAIVSTAHKLEFCKPWGKIAYKIYTFFRKPKKLD